MSNNQKSTLKDVFEKGIVGIHETQDVLAKLFRMLLWTTDIHYTQWVLLLNKWVALSQPPHTDKAIRHTCGNLSKALKEPKISWKMFLKALAILEIDKMDMTLTFHRGKKTTTLELSVEHIKERVLAMDKDDDDEAASAQAVEEEWVKKPPQKLKERK